jgi:hypothetical protein
VVGGDAGKPATAPVPMVAVPTAAARLMTMKTSMGLVIRPVTTE